MEPIAPIEQAEPTAIRLARHLLWRLISPLPDRQYIAIKYAFILGRFPNLKTPKRFTEKLQLRKIADRDPLYNVLVDKADAKAYIAKRAGDQYVIPTYWAGTNLENVAWDTIALPAVVKPTHANAHGYFLRSKADIDQLMAERPETGWLSVRHDRFNREWAYRDLKPRIVIEKMLEDDGKPLIDYRIFAFNGHVVHIKMRYPLGGENYEYTYSPEWQRLDVSTGDYAYRPEEAPKPARLAEMLEVARKLSKGVPFMRVDLYACENWVYVGEMTLYPSGGFEKYEPDDYDFYLGSEWERWNK